VTAITAQNTRGVSGVHAVPPDMVRAQLHAVATDFPVRASKTGMLATRELVELIASLVIEYRLENYVLDPVMVATSGDRLLDRDAESAVRERLLPLATIVTPNLDEAALLVGFEVADEAGMRKAAQQLVASGARAALVKGGHLQDEQIVDVLYDGREFTAFRKAKLDTTNTHGTGCTLSAAITAGLAHGRPLERAVSNALDFVARAIAQAPGLGGGHGPLNHFVRATAE
jgi:hydroxymethylpyrimidine/phosphomethylpyrimidine kinase